MHVHVCLHLCVSVHVCVRAQWRVFERDSTRQSYYCRTFKKQAPILPSVVACWLARAATDRRRQGGHGSGRLLLPNPGPTTGRRAWRDRLGGAARDAAHASAAAEGTIQRTRAQHALWGPTAPSTAACHANAQRSERQYRCCTRFRHWLYCHYYLRNARQIHA